MKDLNRVTRFLWAAALVTLPVTSFRWFPFLGESTLVRPLALYPLALLLPLLLIQAIRRERPFAWAGSMILLAAFAAAVFAATGLGVLIDPIPLRGQEYFGRAVRALITLIIGLSFFISASWMNRDEADVKFTFRWMLAGLGLDLAWSALQAVTFYTPLLEKEMVTHWQLAFSMRELVRTNRISGLAYEPAWLAGQIVTLYLPILFAALMTGIRLTRTKWLEPVLLALSTLMLLATYSRSGILVGVGVAGLTFLLVGRAHLRSAWTWFFGGFRRGWPLRLAMIAAAIGLLSGAVLFLGQKNYFRRLWDTSATSLSEYLVDINAGGRSAYATGALAAFEKHPTTGVGLGASGFWIYDNLPDWTLTTVPEIAKQLNPKSGLFPNPKNLYVRLLAETGLVGFVLFFVFLFSVLADSLVLLTRTFARSAKSPDFAQSRETLDSKETKENFRRFLGIAALFAWLAIALYNVTQDSFATPNIWVIPGIMAGLSINATEKQ